MASIPLTITGEQTFGHHVCGQPYRDDPVQQTAQSTEQPGKKTSVIGGYPVLIRDLIGLGNHKSQVPIFSGRSYDRQ